jgi:DNA-binding CsgD family transcriptional regulator
MAKAWIVAEPRLPPALDPLYERLLGALDGGHFGAVVRGCVEAVTAGATRIYLFDAVAPDEDTLRYVHCEPRIAGLLPAYARHYKRLDPIRALYRRAPRRGEMAMQRVRPVDIGSATFRRRFFDEAGIIERVSIVQRGADRWRGINVARHARHGPLSDRELDNLAGLARLALPMLPLAADEPRGCGVPLSAAELEERFARRCAALTARERQVCARAALGMSVEATALDLGIARSSVLTFRQRAYRRLAVTGPFELLAQVAR